MRVASAQLSPVYLDRRATIDKVLSALKEAAENCARLIAFSETLIPGYPSWVDYTYASYFDQPDQKETYRRYLDAAVDIERGDLQEVTEAARDLGIFTYLGVAERAPSGGSVYCTLVAIDPTKGIVSTHRKLKPTFGERLVWADGDGAGLVVHDWDGTRVGGLNCWENWMPLARAAMYGQGEQIHIATWPGSDVTSRDISRFIAKEGRVFVVSSGGILRAEHLSDDLPVREQMLRESESYASGGSIIVGPDGGVLAEGTPGEEMIIYANLDLEALARERQNFDPTGHYSRPDVLRLLVNRDRTSSVEFH